MSERRDRTNQAHATAALPSQEKQNRNFHQTHLRLTTRRFDDIARDVRDQAIDFAS